MNVKICVHCGRKCGTPEIGGVAGHNGAPLCHPNEDGRPDCYHMVEVYHHPLFNCERCRMDPYVPLTQEEMHDAILSTLLNIDRMVRDCLP